MVDSNVVLSGQTVAYTIYALVIILLMAWFAYRVTKTGKSSAVKPALFYSFVGLLVVLGVSLHIITFNTIPWTPIDLDRSNVKVDRTFDISVAKHKFHLPAPKLIIKCHEKVCFNVKLLLALQSHLF